MEACLFEYKKNPNRYFEELNIYYWIKNEPKPYFKLKKCLYLKHHVKGLSESICLDISKCMNEAFDDMLHDEFDFMKTQSIYNVFESEIGKVDYSILKKQLDTHIKLGVAIRHFTSLGYDSLMATAQEHLDRKHQCFYVGRGMSRPFMYPDPMVYMGYLV